MFEYRASPTAARAVVLITQVSAALSHIVNQCHVAVGLSSWQAAGSCQPITAVHYPPPPHLNPTTQVHDCKPFTSLDCDLSIFENICVCLFHRKVLTNFSKWLNDFSTCGIRKLKIRTSKFRCLMECHWKRLTNVLWTFVSNVDARCSFVETFHRRTVSNHQSRCWWRPMRSNAGPSTRWATGTTSPFSPCWAGLGN